MKKVFKELTEEQKQRGVIFSSCLSIFRTELKNDTIHEVLNSNENKNQEIKRLLDDSFFNKSHFKFNIIRR
jgi:hypothetical protein